MVGNQVKKVAVHPMDCRIIGIAKASGARCNRGEHAARVHRRAGDNLQGLGKGGVLLLRLRKLTL